jgi:D-amino-acid oxidase
MPRTDRGVRFQPRRLVAECSSMGERAVSRQLAARREWRDAVRPLDAPRVAVVGAGVVGLSIAAELAAIGVEDLTVYTDQSASRLASHVAAGLIEPIARIDDDVGARRELEAFRRSYTAWAARAATQRAPVVVLRRVLSYSHAQHRLPEWSRFVDGLREVERHERHRGYEDVPGIGFLSFVVDTPRWMTAAMRTLRARGVRIIRRHFESPDEIRDVDIVVNATGMAAHAFVADASMYRADGHVVYVSRPPGLDEVFMDELRSPTEIARDPVGLNMLYSIPRVADVALGGTFFEVTDPGGSPDPDPRIADRIFELMTQIEPRLVRSQVLGYRRGVRPRRRAGTRLGVECGTYGIPVVHCYGTGGSGWALAPGLAELAVESMARLLWRSPAASQLVDSYFA